MKMTSSHVFELKTKTKNLSKKFQVNSISENDISYKYADAAETQIPRKQTHWWDALNKHLKSVLKKDYERYCKSQEMF